jgi:hypothetical protein
MLPNIYFLWFILNAKTTTETNTLYHVDVESNNVNGPTYIWGNQPSTYYS